MGLHYFGTDGVRGVAGVSLTAEMAYRIGRYIGQYPHGTKNKIIISRDTRESGEMLLNAIVKGMVASGAEVFDEGVSTTPSISYLVRKNHFAYGIMISASHNPYSDNGIKIFNGEGEKLSDAIEEEIEGYMDKKEDDLPLVQGSSRLDPSLKESYIAWLLSKADPKVKNVKLLVDCANGSASAVAPELFKRLGCEVTFIHAEPNGQNINAACGSTHLESLKEALGHGSYDFGFAYDGDADRFMAFSSDGHLIDGDALIYLNALAMRKKKTLHQDKVVITVMSNFGLRKALDEAKIGYAIVAVGDKNVQAKLKEDHLSLGGEQSGHVIFLDDLNTGDGLLSGIKLLNLYEEDQQSFQSLRLLVVYPQVLTNIKVASKEQVAAIMNSKGLADLEAKETLRLGSQGRILVRPSGTEPLIRVMAEALDNQLCHDVVNELVRYISGGK
ncbi:MAG: Phosphoglucosamine mutase [Tenericutes bacterium ADurb.BinA155]|jgi:phosphoglucosamine mutase|nr:MAG: Phosphoglucosamine mutase [Tenericutes bacterium ADurb.BinA155]